MSRYSEYRAMVNRVKKRSQWVCPCCNRWLLRHRYTDRQADIACWNCGVLGDNYDPREPGAREAALAAVKEELRRECKRTPNGHQHPEGR